MLFLGTNEFLGGCFTNGFGQSLTCDRVFGGQESVIERLTSGNRHLVPRIERQKMRTRLDFDVKWGFNLFDMPSTSKRCKIAIRVFAGLLKCVNPEFFPALMVAHRAKNARALEVNRTILRAVDRKMLKGVFKWTP